MIYTIAVNLSGEKGILVSDEGVLCCKEIDSVLRLVKSLGYPMDLVLSMEPKILEVKSQEKLSSLLVTDEATGKYKGQTFGCNEIPGVSISIGFLKPKGIKKVDKALHLEEFITKYPYLRHEYSEMLQANLGARTSITGNPYVEDVKSTTDIIEGIAIKVGGTWAILGSKKSKGIFAAEAEYVKEMGFDTIMRELNISRGMAGSFLNAFNARRISLPSNTEDISEQILVKTSEGTVASGELKTPVGNVKCFKLQEKHFETLENSKDLVTKDDYQLSSEDASLMVEHLTKN